MATKKIFISADIIQNFTADAKLSLFGGILGYNIRVACRKRKIRQAGNFGVWREVFLMLLTLTNIGLVCFFLYGMIVQQSPWMSLIAMGVLIFINGGRGGDSPSVDRNLYRPQRRRRRRSLGQIKFEDYSLIKAVQENDLSGVELWLKKHGNPNLYHNGLPLVMIAASRSGARVMKALLDGGANLNAQYGGCGVLFFASAVGNAEVVKILIERGADVNAIADNGYTALMYAAVEGKAEVVKILLEKGAIQSLSNFDGDTAWDIARQKNHSEICDLIGDTSIFQAGRGL